MNLATGLDYAYYNLYWEWLQKVERKEVAIKEFSAKDGMKIFMLKVPKSEFKDLDEINILTEVHCYIEINDEAVEWLNKNHKVIWE